uniref:Uncharacterized protein n=1 Tax=Oryza brachyantha TaxID=4533 RepID=J3M8G6_ORYBR
MQPLEECLQAGTAASPEEGAESRVRRQHDAAAAAAAEYHDGTGAAVPAMDVVLAHRCHEGGDRLHHPGSPAEEVDDVVLWPADEPERAARRPPTRLAHLLDEAVVAAWAGDDALAGAADANRPPAHVAPVGGSVRHLA